VLNERRYRWSGAGIGLAAGELDVEDAVGNALAEELAHLLQVPAERLLVAFDRVVRDREVLEELGHEVH